MEAAGLEKWVKAARRVAYAFDLSARSRRASRGRWELRGHERGSELEGDFMTRLLMRQNFLSIGDDYTVRDEQDRERYFVDGHVFVLRSQLAIEDMQGQELARVRRRILALGETWDVLRGGESVAVVHKKLFTPFHCTFTVDVPGPDDLVAKGDFLDHEYTFHRGSRTVADVSKRWFTLRDTYGIDIAEGEDEVLILAAAVVIEQCCHNAR